MSGKANAIGSVSGIVGTAGHGVGQMVNVHMEHYTTRTTTSGSSGFTSLFSFNYDKTIATSDLCVVAHVPMYGGSAGSMSVGFTYAGQAVLCGSYVYVPSGYFQTCVIEGKKTGWTTTGSQSLVLGYEAAAGGSHKPCNVHCPNGTDDTRLGQTIAAVLVYEKIN